MQNENTDDDDVTVAAQDAAANGSRWQWWQLALLALLGLLVVVIAVGWSSREKIAGTLISSELERHGIKASYTIESIGLGRQVLANLVLGDPEKPDFTAERVVVGISPRLGVPAVSGLILVKPRLYGGYRQGELSFGSLDPLIFTDSDAPFSLPDLDLKVEDGRGLVESEYGAVGIKLSGSGGLRGGFAGEVAVNAPLITLDGCKARGASLYGKITVQDARPRLSGPVRLGRLDCADTGAHLRKLAIDVDVTANDSLDSGEGDLSVKSGPMEMRDNRLAGAGGTVRLSWRGDSLTARYKLGGNGISAQQFRASRLRMSGSVRALEDFARVEIEGDLDGNLTGMGAPLASTLASLNDSARDTLAGDVISQISAALRHEVRGSTLSGRYILRRNSDGPSLVVPRAILRGRSGSALLSISRLQLRSGGDGFQLLTGNFATGGKGLPQINGRVAQSADKQLLLKLRMPEYRAGSASVAVPRFAMVQMPGGALGFSGTAQLSGAFPGGMVKELNVPLEGNWSARTGLSAWRKCTDLRFDQIELAQARLNKGALQLCPPQGGAIVRSTPGGFKIAGGVPSLDLDGDLGETPLRITSGPIGFAGPGKLDARSIGVSLGQGDATSEFRIDELTARLDGTVSGTLAGAEVLLDAVPLDLRDISGKWRFADGKLELSDGVLRLEDREQVNRFEELIARSAMLQLADNVITADALLREPASDRQVVHAKVTHDLSSGRGGADLRADGIVFDQDVQPDTLSHLALGVIANAEGVVRGTGRIDWGEDAVTSTGRFATDDFDFAAAFGPVKGVSGTVTFTDLLGLVTQPDQTLHIASINPGIEVNDGVLTFDLKPGHVLDIGGAHWPFLGGTLHLEPVTMQIGGAEPLRYVLTIDG
ncbi:MAG: YdbH domain-containing protein, partial [Sphingomonadaceae bacterium]|nr:YdbH domain-containing protein [Sphingomonadaceae bacterium]